MKPLAGLLVLVCCASGIDAPKLNLKHTTSFVVFPADCNSSYPMLFGGKILAEMDRCAAITVRRLLYNSPTGARKAVTVEIKDLRFVKAGRVHDLLFVRGEVFELGAKSVKVSVTVERETEDGVEMLALGNFTFVAFDPEKEKAMDHGLVLEQRR